MSGTSVTHNFSLETQAQRRFFSVRLFVFIAAALFALELCAALYLRRIWFGVQQQATVSIVVFAGCLLLFSYRHSLPAVQFPRSVQPRFALLNGVALLLGAALYLHVAHRNAVIARTGVPGIVPLWWGVTTLLMLSGVLALFSALTLWRTLRAYQLQILAALAAAIAYPYSKTFLLDAWAKQSQAGYLLQFATLRCVQWLLGCFYKGVVCDPRSVNLGTQHFQVTVGYTCSGIEGLALTLSLCLVWLILFRRELILHRAMWMVPLALLAIWTLNIVRITALIAIGDSGHPDMAVRGFHSQAGWISLNLVGFGLIVAAQRLSFLRRQTSTPEPKQESVSGTNPAAALLMPFLAILAASMLTQALSSGFELLYPLRGIAAVLFLWLYRDFYRKLDWRAGWMGPATGVVVIVLWIAYAHLPMAHLDSQSAIPAGLAALSPFGRAFWIGSRALSAIIVIPIAEELAFRGYLARVVTSSNVEEASFRSLTPKAILISSVLFGFMHGRLWPVGILAGVLFALAAKKANRIGEAVAAHATANLLLAVWVLFTGEYALW